MLDIENKLTYHWHIIRGQVTLQHEIVQSILSEAVPFTDSQPIAVMRMKHGKSASGVWSLWHLEVKNQFEAHHTIQPIFISDDGDSFPAFAQDVWSKLIQDDDLFDCTGVLAAEESKVHFMRTNGKAEMILQAKFTETEERLQANTSRIRQNKEKAFAFQEKQLQKIGIENIRQSRMLRLTRERELWVQNFESSKQVVPNLSCLLIIRILNG